MATATTSRRWIRRLAHATRSHSWRRSRRAGETARPRLSPFAPAEAGAQSFLRDWLAWPLGPRFRGDERRMLLKPLHLHRLGGAADHAALRIIANGGEQK